MIERSLLLIKELTPLGSIMLASHGPIIQDLLDKGFFRNDLFSFVGIYYSDKTCTTVVGYPKYIPDSTIEENPSAIIRHVELICRVIEQARSKLDKSLIKSAYDFSAYANHITQQWISTYDLAVFILQDYMDSGIYYEMTRNYKINGKGSINWVRTLSAVYPIIDKDVIYLETFNHLSRKINSPIITPLHAWIVNRCAKLLQGLGRYADLELPEIIEEFDDNSLSQYVPHILSRLSYVFYDRDIRLLKALSAWCGKSSFYRDRFGVTSFDRIWEFATKKVFGNVDNTKSGPPDYCICGLTYKGRGGSIPDILRVFSNKQDGKGYIGILDAKYYRPILNDDALEIYGAPSNADITKQISYYRYLKQQYPGDNIMFTNAFLLPSFTDNKTELYQHIGFAVNSDQSNREIEERLDGVVTAETMMKDVVLLYQVNPTKLYEACLNGLKIDNCTFIDTFILPFQETETRDVSKSHS